MVASMYLTAKRCSLAAFLALALSACAPPASRTPPSVLLFTGAGTSANDVAAVRTILDQNQLTYATATSAELNAMGRPQLRAYRLLIVPGGNFLTMADSLTPGTTANIHAAVEEGLNYLGICAGGFLAGDARYNSLRLAPGVQFGFYAEARRGVRKAAVPIAVVGAPVLEQYWEDGPEFTGWGDVVARYPDRTPAIVEGHAGKGWVILTGIHAEAPESWRGGMTFATPASVDNAYAAQLIGAALEGRALAQE